MVCASVDMLIMVDFTAFFLETYQNSVTAHLYSPEKKKLLLNFASLLFPAKDGWDERSISYFFEPDGAQPERARSTLVDFGRPEYDRPWI
jgi:hypothetical protein